SARPSTHTTTTRSAISSLSLHDALPSYKLFFFMNYEQYLLPGTKSYTCQILTTDALSGNFSYCPTGTSNAACVANPGLLKTTNRSEERRVGNEDCSASS